jgi:hypothetical protein
LTEFVREADNWQTPRSKHDRGEYLLDNVGGQDALAWVTPGAIADRTLERLGTPDRGVTMFRKMLLRELEKVESGADPMCVFRGSTGLSYDRSPGGHGRNAPVAGEVLALFDGVLV